MVYFTDGYGESSIPKPLTHKNLWVVMENEKNLSVKNPYGKVVSIKNKELRKHG
jgi:predicted metal-dependent peptidase